MIIYDLLKQSEHNSVKNYLVKLKQSESEDNKKLKDKVNKILGNLNKKQEEIVLSKFKNKNRSQVIDHFAEILVAHYYLNKTPTFLKEKESDSEADLYLEETGQKVEVKNINLSDKQRDVIEEAIKEGISENTSEINKNDEISSINKLNNKTKEHIEKAITKQIRPENKGVVFLVYSLDLSSYYLNQELRKDNFKKEAEKNFEKIKKEGDAKEIELVIFEYKKLLRSKA